MKRTALAFWAALAACAEAPPTRIAPPAAAPLATAERTAADAGQADAPPETQGDVTVASVRGMKVIVERVPGAEFAAVHLAIRGGVRNGSPERAGAEAVGLAVATSGGTHALSKEQLARKLASLGATLTSTARSDFSVLGGVAPTASFDQTFRIVADALLDPALPEREIEVVRQRALSDRRHELEDGDGRLGILERRAVFSHHPYATRPEGEIGTLTALTADAVTAHLAKLRETSRLLLVVVGDVDASHVIDLVRAAFAGVPRGHYVETPIPALHFDGPRAIGDAHPLATNYVAAFFAGPSPADPDYVPVRVMIAVLSHRVWDEVRAKRNLSYAPWAMFRWYYAAPYGGFYVSTVDPSAAMQVMMDEARRVQTDLVPPDELLGVKTVFRTRCEQNREAIADEAALLGDGQLYAGDWRFYRRYCEASAGVSAEQIRTVARKYMKNWQSAIVGDPTKLDPKLVGAAAIDP